MRDTKGHSRKVTCILKTSTLTKSENQEIYSLEVSITRICDCGETTLKRQIIAYFDDTAKVTWDNFLEHLNSKDPQGWPIREDIYQRIINQEVGNHLRNRLMFSRGELPEKEIKYPIGDVPSLPLLYRDLPDPNHRQINFITYHFPHQESL